MSSRWPVRIAIGFMRYPVHEWNCDGLGDSAATGHVTDFELWLKDESALPR